MSAPSRTVSALALLLCALAAPDPLSAQEGVGAPTAAPAAPSIGEIDPLALPRWYAGVAAGVGRPSGAFRRNVTQAGGVQGHVRLRLDPRGRLSLRLEGGYLNYGHESQRTCLASTPGCRVAVNVNTVNGILSAGVGPELSVPMGPMRVYAHGLVGASRLATASGLGSGLLPDIIAADEHFGDGGFTWSTGAGLSVPVSRAVAVDVGVSYQGHGQRDYLVKGGVTDNADGTLDFDVKRSATNLLAFRLGVTTALSRKKKP
jgi:opacity protein-like surface antigen